MNWVDIIGYLAGVCTAIAFLPQVIKSWKTKKTKDISFPTFFVLASGVFLWVVYGIFYKAWPIILANSVTFGLAMSILYLKVKYK